MDEEELEENVIKDEESSKNKDEETPMAEDNRTVLKKINIEDYEKAFQDLYLELLDWAKAYEGSKVNFTNALLNTGLQINPQDIYGYIDSLSSRLEKIHIVKRLCNLLGLHNEVDKLVNAEIDLIYNKPQPKPRSTTTSYGDSVVGDLRNAKPRR